jgi:hypothetical protein
VSRRLGSIVAALTLPLLLGTCKGTSEPLVATAIVVTPSPTVSLAAIGASQQLTAVVKDQNGNTLASAGMAWTTSNNAVVTVTGTGLVTAIANGSAQVSVTSGSATTSVSVTVAQAATQLVKVSGDLQTATMGQTLAQPIVVRVNDATGHAIAGASVGFAAAAGSGSVGSASVTTNASGQAQSTWTLGNVGTDTLRVTAIGAGIGGNPAVFTATSQAAAGAANVAVYAGNNQMGLVGYPVNVRPAVRVTDAGSNPVSGAAVAFAVASGGGSLTGGTATTNTNGIAQVGSWTLGNAPAKNTIIATVTGAGIAGNPVTFSDTGAAAAYNIQIQYYGPAPTAAEQAAFNAAVTKWQSIIYQHVGPPILVTDAGDECGAGEPAVSQSVTDVLILATFDSIDGPSKILAYAGPCFIRTSNSLTLLGVMVFDTADVATLIANSQLNTVILHEMNHVLGYGTLWDQPPNACLQLPSTSPGMILDTYFNCPKGRAAFDSIGGTSSMGGGSSPPAGNKVPVENCGTAPVVSPTCGAGTVNSHWREVVFGNELMTGYINSGSNPLSVVSIAAQEDLGYTVNYAGADAYSHIFMAPAVGGAPPFFLGDDVRHGPIYVVDARGTVVRVIHR